ncbi:MAG TPA: YoaK family protein [Terracidiphilus sp.]|nr:YoaK family protein [Terracidiphilus sp.]
MRTGERDLLLMILAASAGSADGWSYFGIGHAFVANMTGNTVLLGVNVFRHTGEVLHPAIAIGCYAAGVIFASALTRNLREGDPWPRSVSATLLLESLILFGAEITWAAIFRHSAHDSQFAVLFRNVLLGAVGFAVGMQSGAMVQLKIPGVVTTYITGTWTSLMNGIVDFASGRDRTPPRKKVALEERLLLQGAILAAYFLAAMLVGWILQRLPAAAGAVPAASVFVVAVFGLTRGGAAA